MSKWQVLVQGRAPSLERDVASALVRWALPNLTDEEVEQAVAQRALRQRSVFTTVVTEANVQMLSEPGNMGGGFEDEQSALEKEVAAAKASKPIRAGTEKRTPPPQPKGPVGSSASSSGVAPPPPQPAEVLAGAAPGQLRVVEYKKWTVAEARLLLPKVQGCVLAVNKGVAWEAKYPRDEPPRSRSITFDPECLQANRRALLAVLRWAWRAHREKHPAEECPWDLEGAV